MTGMFPVVGSDDALIARNKRLQSLLVPQYPVGCNRLLISHEYLVALGQSNVQVLSGTVTSLSKDAVHIKVCVCVLLCDVNFSCVELF